MLIVVRSSAWWRGEQQFVHLDDVGEYEEETEVSEYDTGAVSDDQEAEFRHIAPITQTRTFFTGLTLTKIIATTISLLLWS